MRQVPAKSFSKRSQHGAALIIGLILLLVLTVLAVSGMTTASSELTMAGNEQARLNAFQAAEIGFEQAIQQATTDPGGGVQTFTGTVPNAPAYTYTVTFTPNGSTNGFMLYGTDDVTAYYFDIRSVGSSARGSAVNEGGVAQIGPKGFTLGCIGPPPCSFD